MLSFSDKQKHEDALVQEVQGKMRRTLTPEEVLLIRLSFTRGYRVMMENELEYLRKSVDKRISNAH